MYNFEIKPDSGMISSTILCSTSLISKSRLRELEFLEKNLDTIVRSCAMERIMNEATECAEEHRLKHMAKKQAQAKAAIQKMDAFFNDVYIGNLEGVQNYLETGGVLSVRTPEGDTALHVSVQYNRDDITLFILENLRMVRDTTLVNAINAEGNTPLHIACLRYNALAIEDLLLSGANPNIQNNDQDTPLHSAVKTNNIDSVRSLLHHKADILVRDAANKLPQDYAESCEMKSILQKHRSMMRIWKGWAFEDVEQMDTIFTEHAANYSYCPICLKFFERDKGCIYLSHNCAAEGRTYHKALYSRYITSNGIQWCSVCNRISNNFRHYSKTSYDSNECGTLSEAGNLYEDDCRVSNSGGGVLEKYTRFLELRNCAYNLIDHVGEISEENAISQLVESMWDAPFVHKRPQKFPWKLRTDQFPLRSEMAVVESRQIYVPLKRPDADKDLLPEIHESGRNVVSLDTRYKLIQFRHRMEDGTINDHDEEGINIKSLYRFMKDVIHQYKTGLDCESLGFCWNRQGGCTAVLYPEEILHAMNELGCVGNEDLNLFSEYERCFNEKFT